MHPQMQRYWQQERAALPCALVSCQDAAALRCPPHLHLSRVCQWQPPSSSRSHQGQQLPDSATISMLPAGAHSSAPQHAGAQRWMLWHPLPWQRPQRAPSLLPQSPCIGCVSLTVYRQWRDAVRSNKARKQPIHCVAVPVMSRASTAGSCALLLHRLQRRWLQDMLQEAACWLLCEKAMCCRSQLSSLKLQALCCASWLSHPHVHCRASPGQLLSHLCSCRLA